MATLGTLRGYVRNLTLERTGDVGLITDSEANDIINICARQLWIRLVSHYTDLFSQRSVGNLPVPATAILPFSTITTGNVHEILHVYVGATGAAESAMKHLVPFDKSQDRWLYEPPPVAPALPFRWYVEGNTNLIFTPIPAGTFDARVAWVQTPTDMAADGDTPWGNKLPEYHDHIAILASVMVSAKDQNLQTGFDKVFQYLDRVMSDDLGTTAGRALGRAQASPGGGKNDSSANQGPR